MASHQIEFTPGTIRGNLIRLRTMILVRWVAILGQIVAITVASLLFDLQVELGLCSLVIGTSIVANLIATFIYPENKRLSEGEMTWMLVFDISQLAALLFLTGGLNNPFALLILAPVTISATTLNPKSTIIIGGLGVLLVSLVARLHIPLRFGPGDIMALPADFLIGIWAALVIGIVFLGIYAQRVALEISSMGKALLATQMALAREQKLTDLSGVVAATAHELGTPLATIKLTSSELADDLSDRADLRDDALLIREQADRCAAILRSMGRAGKDDKHLAMAPFSAIIREAAEPHLNRGKEVIFSTPIIHPEGNAEPIIMRMPEIIHGVRNLIQNAVDFSQSTVWVDTHWDARKLSVKITDDGQGYPPNMLGRIGEPFTRERRNRKRVDQRPEYEGMGLGAFIAKTLLERSGAELTFINGRDPYSAAVKSGEKRGAIVEAAWNLADMQTQDGDDRVALGENQPITS